MSVFSGCLIICFLLNLILGASSSEFHSISSTSESPQNQEELKKWKQKTKIVETEKLKGENKIKRHYVVVNSNNNLLFDQALKNYLNNYLKGENKINPLSLKISSVILLTVCHTGRVTLVWGIWYCINLLSPY